MLHPLRRGRDRLAPLVIPLAAGAVALAGCSSSGKGDSNSSSPSPSVPTATDVIQVNTPPGTAKHFVGARKDVTDLSCRQDGSSWVVSGTVTNSSTAKADYRIYTSFLNSANDTRGLLETDVTAVAPKVSKQWTGSLSLPDDGLKCVLRVERTRSK
jgi:hypothetical protein